MSHAPLESMTHQTTQGRVSPSPEAKSESGLRDMPNAMSEENQRVQDMLSEGGGVVEPNFPVSDGTGTARPRSEVVRPERRLLAWLEDFSQKWGAGRLQTLVRKRGRLSESMGVVPENMHRVANQTRLVLELVDDFRDGTYREISWRSIALLVGGLLYSISPADVIPDVLPIIGQMDDLAVLAIVTRLVQGDLRKYCQFRGYEESDYFRMPGKT